jgi:hypothetical protein
MNVQTHLWMPLKTSSLLAHTRLIHLGRDDLQQIQGIINTRRSIALNLLAWPSRSRSFSVSIGNGS